MVLWAFAIALMALHAWFLMFVGFSKPWVFFIGAASGYSVITLYLIHKTARQSFSNLYLRRPKGLAILIILIETPVVISWSLFYSGLLPLPNGMGLYWIAIIVVSACVAESLKYLLRSSRK